MTDPHKAEEHLRIIRTLMERATIYRAISAPTALVGGVISVLIAALSLFWKQTHNQPEEAPHFLRWWLLALLITGGANTLFIWRAAAQRGEPLLSPSLKLALKALSPPCLAGGVVSLAVGMTADDPYVLAIVWTICYGLALLATAHFAPPSLLMLGWAFLAAGLAAFLFPYFQVMGADQLVWPEQVGASWLMGATFGVFHLFYAACAWPRRVA